MSTAVLPLWPRSRSTAVLLAALVLVQAVVFFVVTEPAFFVGDDYHHFQLSQERSFLVYLLTPLLSVYPAPGHRLVTFLLQETSPLNYTVARLFFLVLLGATTVLLGHLVRTFARSDAWWTVALLVPFALSLTLVSPVWWWSNGLPVFPALLFTAIALAAWVRSYTDPRPTRWLWVTVLAIAAAGGFYLKFLLIPVYLLLMRVLIFPRILNTPAAFRQLWAERMRWLAVSVPPAAFLAVFVLSGLASRSVSPGERPYLEYFATAWFEVLVPVSFLNIPVESATSGATFWAVVLAGQALFWVVFAATVRRSPLALRGWAFFLLAFLANAAIVGVARLPRFGLEIAYWLRYYPEVVFFLPLALALGLRQGTERRPEVAWEKTTFGRVAIGLLACVYAVSFAIWAPRTVSESEGAPAGAWFDNLHRGIAEVAAGETPLHLVDSETPDYIMASWMAPRNRISRVLGLLELDVVYNQLVEPTYVVLEDGRLVEAAFTPISLLVSEATVAEGIRILHEEPPGPAGTCIGDGGLVIFEPDGVVRGDRLALKVVYSEEATERSRAPVAVEVETGEVDRQNRGLELRPFDRDAELLDLSTTEVRALRLEPAPGDVVCIARLEIGSLPVGGP